MSENPLFLAFDLGGTKLASGVVTPTGEVAASQKLYLELERGKDFFLAQMIATGKNWIQKFPSIRKIGISSCGPLDSQKGELHDPTNLLTQGKGWGVVPLKEILQSELQCEVFLENDADCSALAELWLGLKAQNMMVLCLGTGLGTGIVVNGQLFRGGRFLHPEAGHMIIAYQDQQNACACGVYGDAEAYLSGKNFENYCQLQGSEIIARSQKGDPKARQAFARYAETLAATLHNYCVIFSPDWIVFSGSFAAALDQFLPATQERLKYLLRRTPNLVPQLTLSQLNNQACLLGAASLCSRR